MWATRAPLAHEEATSAGDERRSARLVLHLRMATNHSDDLGPETSLVA